MSKRANTTTKATAKQNKSKGFKKQNFLSGEGIKFVREEVWSDIDFTAADAATVVKRLNFDPVNGPAWFKKFCTLYEKYQIHKVVLTFKTGMPSTSTGRYVLSYNTNFDEKTAARTYAELGAQKGSKSAAIYKDLTIVIPGGALPHFRTNASASNAANADNWQFNVEIMRSAQVAFTGQVNIKYFVTFRNPQI